MKKSNLNKIRKNMNIPNWDCIGNNIEVKIKKVKPFLGFKKCISCNDSFIFERIYMIKVLKHSYLFDHSKKIYICDSCLSYLFGFSTKGMKKSEIFDNILKKIKSNENNIIKEKVMEALEEIDEVIAYYRQ